MDPPLTPDLVLNTYCQGAFPMADSRDGPVAFYRPDPRAILPLNSFHIRRSLQKALRKQPFKLTVNQAFEQVITGCAEPRPTEEGETWINPKIIEVYTELHHLGFAHSIEAWHPKHPDQLLGGLYGLAIRGGFFAESMFSRQSYASQACLVALVQRLRDRGFDLLDVQMTNPHLEQFGVQLISCEKYLTQLEAALQVEAMFD